MDVALLSANANQLRYVVEGGGEFKEVLIGLLIVSITLQVLASCLLIFDRTSIRQTKNYKMCLRLQKTIAIMAVLIIVINIVVIAFSEHEKDDKPPY